MIVGVDFDNTLVCYDQLFHQLALEQQWINPATPANKSAVRDTMRQAGLEPQWVHLQGEVYGRHILNAPTFPHAKSFFQACATANITLYIISHKTKYPAGGQPYDLHAAARQWLTEQGFCAPATGDIDLSHVFFEATASDKIVRIAQLQCDHFIDDLPEFLAHPAFPTTTQKWLFDPNKTHRKKPNSQFKNFRGGWDEVMEQLIPLTKAAS